jgi:hypothetical protein
MKKLKETRQSLGFIFHQEQLKFQFMNR